MMRQAICTTGLTGLLLLASTAPAEAGGRGHGHARGDGAFQVRVGGFFLDGGGQVWTDNNEIFDLNASDLDNGVLGLTFVNSISRHVEIGFNADFYDAEASSSVRGVVDPAGFPIRHETRLKLTPLSIDFRVLPGGRRRGPGPIPYFGAGVGLVRWNYQESGEFVDFADPGLPIFDGSFEEDGLAFQSHVLAGVEVPLSRAASFLVEARHTWADDQLDSADFPDFGRLELGGSSLYLGASFRF